MAEREGFEPPEPFGSPHFECGAIDHSATSPAAWGREPTTRTCERKPKVRLMLGQLRGKLETQLRY